MIQQKLNINIILSIILLALQLIFIPIFSNNLGVSEYGIFMLYKSLSHQGMCAIFAFGINNVIRTSVADAHLGQINFVDLRNLFLTVIATAPLIFSVSIFLPGDLHISNLYILIFILSELFLVYIVAVAEGARKLISIRTCDIIILFILICASLVPNVDLVYIIYMYFTLNIVKGIYLTVTNTLPTKSGADLRIQKFRKALGPLSIASMLGVFNNNFERYLFSIFVGLESIIYLDLIQKFYKLFKYQISILVLVVQPYFQKIRHSVTNGSILNYITEIFMSTYILTIILFYITIDLCILFWMGVDYLSVVKYIVYTIPAIILFLWSSLYGMMLIVDERYETSLSIQVSQTVFRLAITFCFISLFSYWVIVLNIYVMLILAYFLKKSYPDVKLSITFIGAPVSAVLIIYICEHFLIRDFLFKNLELNIFLSGVIFLCWFFSIHRFVKLCSRRLQEN